MAFYKNENGVVYSGPNFVKAPTFELLAEYHTTYNYPINGWYWFETEEEAYTFFGLEIPNHDEEGV